MPRWPPGAVGGPITCARRGPGRSHAQQFHATGSQRPSMTALTPVYEHGNRLGDMTTARSRQPSIGGDPGARRQTSARGRNGGETASEIRVRYPPRVRSTRCEFGWNQRPRLLVRFWLSHVWRPYAKSARDLRTGDASLFLFSSFSLLCQPTSIVDARGSVAEFISSRIAQHRPSDAALGA
jgi:hypothetical protein